MAGRGEVVVRILGDISGLGATLGEADVKLGHFGKSVEAKGSAFDKLASVGKASFLGIAGAAVGFGAVAIKAALEGEQAHAKLVHAVQNSGQSFAKFQKPVDDASARMAKFGFVNDEVEVALAHLTTATNDPKKALDELGLAANIARARNMSLTEASDLLGKTMAGNTRALKQMGINLSELGVRSHDANAILALLNERFAGAAQASANTYAGRLAAAKAQFENLTEQVGNHLLPVMARLVGDLATGVHWLSQHETVAKALAVVIAGPLVAALGAFLVKEALVVRSKLAEVFASIGNAVWRSAAALSSFTGVLGEVGATGLGMVGVLIAAGAAVAVWAEKSGKSIADVKVNIKDLTEKSDADFGKWVANLHKLTDGMESSFKRTGTSSDQLADVHKANAQKIEAIFRQVAEGNEAAAQRFIASEEAKGHSTANLRRILDDVHQGHVRASKDSKENAASIDKETDSTVQATGASRSWADSLQDMVTLEKLAQDETKRLSQQLDSSFGAFVNAKQGAIDLADRIQALNDELRLNNTLAGGSAEHHRKLESALIAVVSAAQHETDALAASGAIADTADAKHANLAMQLINLEKQFPTLKGPIDEYIAELNKIPTSITTQIEAVATVQALYGGATPVPHRAVGGSAYAHVPLLVGDAGRSEVFVPNEDGNILTEDQARPMMGRGGPNVEIKMYGTDKSLAHEMRRNLVWDLT